MTFAPKALLLLSALALAACNNPDRYGAGGGVVDPGGAFGGGAGGVDQMGLASDPNSPAYFAQTIGDKVLFAVDQSTLGPDAQNTLRGQAQWLAGRPQYSAIIEGHADEQGTREYNLALGARRANSVQEYLISQGVAPNRLRTVSYGKERPLAVCSTEQCYSQNRRAVTVISIGAGS
ncbi:peptidoglycan-associated lipoprotein Pal [Pontitalea aquivivens]|uniref:peptidoglycan-associated lipoprotein Pal n=1 Tax=Pontitalea aquivivens TaxID=3388663 RepID=UPI0039704DEF